MFDRWSKAVVRDVKIDERAAHEDAGSVDLLVESVFAIDEENIKTLSSEQASTLESGKSCANNSYVVVCPHELTAKSFTSQSPSYAPCEVPSRTLRDKEAMV